jgi:uncharacterized membrane protein (DUF106 family)
LLYNESFYYKHIGSIINFITNNLLTLSVLLTALTTSLFADTPPLGTVDSKKFEQEATTFKKRSKIEKEAQEEFYTTLALIIDGLRSNIEWEGDRSAQKKPK